ncbi:hypothetical protein AEQ67_18260 [Pseudomonas sp. RIT-PI-q]|uniref:hypothetical protein n=1 Tax=Pseudomonas sp. RIT-PI-q TaxID=1690247 RepID=UPI0006CC4D17|nr:hypothetical protein [Pseudomonas sp. RIT-PI-q]KPG95900.1 hypothetical protein AEQ67_18260 [Pseudomonas sp. RIT-PI-q]
MSEWEEFCESRGFSIGEEDYDKAIDSLEGRSSQRTLREPAPCDLSQEEVSVLLARDSHGVPTKADVELMVWTGQSADYLSGTLDGVLPGADDSLVVRFRDDSSESFASLDMVIEDLRVTSLPLQSECQLLIWDAKAHCVASWQGLVRESFIAQRTDSFPSTQAAQNLLHLLDRAKGADHALKPLLIAASEVERAKAGLIVEFLEGSSLSLETLHESFLVYVTSKGVPVSVSLGAIEHFVQELHTRNGSYKFINGAVRTVNGPARLTAGAIHLAKSSNRYATYYLRAEHGTIYQPVFRKIPDSDINEHDPSSVFVTDGSHPLELNGTHSPDRFVTNLLYFERYENKLEL